MKKFNFRLAGYQRIKAFEEKNAWNEVLKQEARVLKIKQAMDNLEMDIRKGREDMSRVGENSVPRWHLAEEAIGGLTARIQQLQQEYNAEMRLLEKLVIKHREAKKEAKIIENYEDRKRAEFKEDKAKHDEIQRNETATQSFMRKVK